MVQEEGDGGGVVNIDEGKMFFCNYCVICYNKNMKDDLIGFVLGGVEECWVDYLQEDFYKWICQFQAMINEGYFCVVEFWEDWKLIVMNNFLNFSDLEIDNILVYIEVVYIGVDKKNVVGGEVVVVVVEEKFNNIFLFIVFVVILVIFVVVLVCIVFNFNYML